MYEHENGRCDDGRAVAGQMQSSSFFIFFAESVWFEVHGFGFW